MAEASEIEAVLRDLESMPVFSDHCHHLPDEFFRQPVTLDLLMNKSYVSWTGFCCDGTAQARRLLLDNVRFNSYYVWLERGVRQVHGIEEEISVDNWDAVSAVIAARHRADARFHWQALRDKGFERLILDTYWDPGQDGGHPEVFTPAYRIDKFMYGYHVESVAPDDFRVWERYGFTGGSMDDFVEMMLDLIRRRWRQGKVAALKCAEAYCRPIQFMPDDREAARAVFGKHPDRTTEAERIAFGNYVFNRACDLAAELKVPFQVHTGLARLAGSQPLNLEPIIARYPNVTFVLFHAGYPWTHQVAGLAHNYRNVAPSLTWTPTISTSAAVAALHDFIDAACSCNTITWGDDCWTAEESVGALLAWRFVVATVLAERFRDGRLSARGAEALGRKLLRDNGRSVYPRAFSGASPGVAGT